MLQCGCLSDYIAEGERERVGVGATDARKSGEGDRDVVDTWLSIVRRLYTTTLDARSFEVQYNCTTL